MKLPVVLFFTVFLFNTTVKSQSRSSRISGTINHEYLTHEDPIKITYKVYPYGGSGDYEYRWRVQGGEFLKGVTGQEFVKEFNCSKSSVPRIMVMCEIKDKKTNKKILIKTKHPIEFCLE